MPRTARTRAESRPPGSGGSLAAGSETRTKTRRTHLACKSQSASLLALDTQRLGVLVVDAHEVNGTQAKCLGGDHELGAVVQELGAGLGACDSDVGAVYAVVSICFHPRLSACHVLPTVLSSKEKGIEMAFSCGGDALNLDHCLGALDHTDDAERVGAAAAFLGRTQRVDTRDDPLDLVWVVGLRKRDGLNVARAQLAGSHQRSTEARGLGKGCGHSPPCPDRQSQSRCRRR